MLYEVITIPWPQPEQIKPYLQHVCSMPVWLTKEVMRQLPNDEARALGESLAGQAPLTLRVNTLKTSVAAYLQLLQDAGHAAKACRYAGDVV